MGWILHTTSRQAFALVQCLFLFLRNRTRRAVDPERYSGETNGNGRSLPSGGTSDRFKARLLTGGWGKGVEGRNIKEKGREEPVAFSFFTRDPLRVARPRFSPSWSCKTSHPTGRR